MKIISKTGDARFATVYIAQVRDDPCSLIEFVDAVDPRYSREEKWVIIVSTQIGCPISCLMCDSGTYFLGNLTKEEIFEQIDYVINRVQRHQHEFLNHPKLKIQFARMGEPSLNPNVLDVLNELPGRYPFRGLMPCVATTAPHGTEEWFERLIYIKNTNFNSGRFQLQFSLNSTDELERDKFMPVKKWTLEEIAKYGDKYFKNGDRKATLNFALAKTSRFETEVIGRLFNPNKFLVKITPVNPTGSAIENNIDTIISHESPNAVDKFVSDLNKLGFETIISIGTKEEIAIGSNCGQSAKIILKTKDQKPKTQTKSIKINNIIWLSDF